MGTAGGDNEPSRLTHCYLASSLLRVSLLWVWLSHVALTDRVAPGGVSQEGWGGKGLAKEVEVLGSNRALPDNLSQRALLFGP